MKIILKNIEKGQTVSYSRMTDEKVVDTNWQNVTIEGCILTNCSIKNVDLSNSDVIGTTYVKNIYNNIDFTHSDICSCIASDTKFENVNFSMSTMRDCEFNNCMFINCKFEHIAMTHTKFKNCIFEEIHIEQSSSYLNEFYSSSFKKCHFNGNFFYSIFSNCCIGDNFMSNRLYSYNIFPHNEAATIELDKDTVEYLEKNYLFFNNEIYKLNAGLINLDTFVLESLSAIAQIIKYGIVIRLEQIEFMLQIFKYTCMFSNLTLLTISQGIRIIDKTIEESQGENTSLQKSLSHLIQLRNQMYIEYIHRINMLPQTKISDPTTEYTTFKITYSEEPQIKLCEIINSILLRLNIEGEANRIHTEKGSFIEFIKTLSTFEPLIQLVLTVSTGVIVPILVAKMDKSNKKEITPIQYTQNNYQINSNLNSPTVINNYNITITDSQNPKVAVVVVQTLNDYNLNAANGYLGYSKENVKSVIIIDSSDTQ